LTLLMANVPHTGAAIRNLIRPWVKIMTIEGALILDFGPISAGERG
jgi:hypothetical protein